MDRKWIYTIIDEHREQQDARWPRNVEVNAQRAQYEFYAPHILILEEKLKKLRENWYKSDREQLQKDFISMAAIAIRALEEVK